MGDIYAASKNVDEGDTAIFSEKMKVELKDWSENHSIRYMDKINAFLEHHQNDGLHIVTTQVAIQMALMYGFEVGFNIHDVGCVR